MRKWRILVYAGVIIAVLLVLLIRPNFAQDVPDPAITSLIKKFAQDKDANIRALAILASSHHKISDPALGALIHGALLDKDPLVRKAAKLVIEENFGIRLEQGAEGIHQAHALINDVGTEALLMKTGSP